MMAHDVEEELPVSQIHTVDDGARNDGENGLDVLNDATVDVLIYPIKDLLQRREHRPTWTFFTWVDTFQRFRALTPYSKAFEVFEKGIEERDETVECSKASRMILRLCSLKAWNIAPFRILP